MSEAVYRDYDSDALFAQYDNRAQVTEEALNSRSSRHDQNAHGPRPITGQHAARKHLDVAYGPHEREKLDIFLPHRRRRADVRLHPWRLLAMERQGRF